MWTAQPGEPFSTRVALFAGPKARSMHTCSQLCVRLHTTSSCPSHLTESVTRSLGPAGLASAACFSSSTRPGFTLISVPLPPELTTAP